MMQLSDKGVAFIRNGEALKTKMYVDSAGYATIGIGHKLLPTELKSGKLSMDGTPWRDGITEAKALQLYAHDLKPRVDAVNRLVKVPLTEDQHAALVSLVFNIGEENFRTSTLLRRLNLGDYNGAEAQFSVWNKVTVNRGTPKERRVRNEGLANRRADEVRLWKGQV